MTPLGAAQAVAVAGAGRWVSHTRPGGQETQRLYACTVINLINVLNLQDVLYVLRLVLERVARRKLRNMGR